MVKMNIFYKIRKKPKNVPQKTFFSKIAKQRRLELKICTILYAYSLHPAWGKLLFPQHLLGSSNGVPCCNSIMHDVFYTNTFGPISDYLMERWAAWN